MTPVRTFASTAILAAVLTVTGCASDDATDNAETSTPSQNPTNSSPPAGGGFDQGQLDQIKECLDAAGLEDVLPTDVPSDMPTNLPSDMPSDFDPDNLPEGAGGPGGGLAALQDPEVQDALDACGIELPQPPTPAEGDQR